MKKNSIMCLLMVFSVLICCLPMPAQATRTDASCHGLEAQQALDNTQKVLDTAKSVILYELNTDTMVYSYNADRQVNPTGLVKLLTVLVALEAGNLDDVVKVYQSTLNTVAVGSVSAGLKSGEELTLRDLLYCIMVSSANDACAVVAAHLGGSQSGFVEMMNAKAAELGCTASNFANAHGLNDASQHSTARDLAIITKAALENPQFQEMFGTTVYTVPATNKSGERSLKTTNHMMRSSHTNYDLRISGGKPAAATTTDRSMICTAEIGSARYLCVVMNAKGSVSEDGLVILRYGIFEEVSALLDYAYTGFEVRQILDDSQTMYQYPVDNGSNDVLLRPATDVSVVLPRNCEPANLYFDHSIDIVSCTAPIQGGQKVGSITIYYNGLVMGSCELLAVTSVEQVGSITTDSTRIDVPVDNNDVWTKILLYGGLILLALLILCLLGYLTFRWIRNAIYKRKYGTKKKTKSKRSR